MKRKFAAFDVDGTLGRTALFFQIVDELISEGHLPKKSRKELDEKFEDYKRRKHSNAFADYSELSVQVLFKNMHKLKVTDYKKAVDKVVKHSAQYLYTYTRDLAAELKSKGYFLIALSGSEIYAVEKYTKPLGFDLAIGETYFEKDGLFTGEAEEVFRNKDIFLKKYVEEHNLTFKDSYALGDSLADSKMLELVDNPIAFNPEDRLYEVAKEKGWKIVIERKNVIYKLENKNGTYILE